MASNLTFFGRFLETNPGWLLYRMIHLDFTRSMTVVKYGWGHAIETNHVDDMGMATLEVLTTINGATATLISRERYGAEHSEMRSYPRDDRFPVGCVVKLFKDREPC